VGFRHLTLIETHRLKPVLLKQFFKLAEIDFLLIFAAAVRFFSRVQAWQFIGFSQAHNLDLLY
jgi:hypothetical protein